MAPRKRKGTEVNEESVNDAPAKVARAGKVQAPSKRAVASRGENEESSSAAFERLEEINLEERIRTARYSRSKQLPTHQDVPTQEEETRRLRSGRRVMRNESSRSRSETRQVIEVEAEVHEVELDDRNRENRRGVQTPIQRPGMDVPRVNNEINAQDRTHRWVDQVRPDPPFSNESADATSKLTEAIQDTLRAVRESSTIGSNSQLIHRLNLAKKLPEFSGNPLEWRHFKSTYESSTTLAGYSDRENLMRLFEALRGEARESVEAILATTENPQEILQVLELQYGNEHAIAERILNTLDDLPSVNSGEIKITQFATKIANAVSAFKSLALTGYLHSLDLVKRLGSKLSNAMRSSFNRYAAQIRNGKTILEKLADFLYEEAQFAAVGIMDVESPCDTNRAKVDKLPTAQKTTLLRTRSQPRQNNNSFHRSVTTLATAHNAGPDTSTSDQTKDLAVQCAICKRTNHSASECAIYSQESVERRWLLAKENKMCFRCLKTGHRSQDCANTKCPLCRRAHHHLLHGAKPLRSRTSVEAATNTQAASSATRPSGGMRLDSPRILLKVLPVRVLGPESSIETYALLDDASTITIIDQSLAREVGIKGTRIKLRISGINNHEAVEFFSEKVDFDLTTQNGRFNLKGAVTKKNLSLVTQSLVGDLVNYARSITGVDIKEYCNAQPKVLIGQDNWQLITTRECHTVENSIGLSRSMLGWTVHGFLPKGLNKATTFCVDAQSQTKKAREKFLENDEELKEMMRNYFALDNFGTRETPKQNKQERSQKILENTSKRVGCGWEVGLLWARDLPPNVNSKQTALKRLRMLENRLDRDPEYAAAYCKEIQRFIDNGYAVKMANSTVNAREWYLPHFGVSNANKPGKIRLVFDAAAKTAGLSLNDHLDAGPDLLESLPGILLRFRRYAIGLKTDIKDMFLRIKMRQEDRAAQRFLWRGLNRDREPEIFEMDCLIFGAKSSPSSAIHIKNKNATEFLGEMREAANHIIRNSYMDDLLISVKTETEALKMVQDVTEINSKANFIMHPWVSNSSRLLHGTSSQDTHSLPNNNKLMDDGKERVLGLYWDTCVDELKFNINVAKIPNDIGSGKIKPTKREVLSIVMSVFDSLGFLAPFVVKSRILMHQICLSGIEWDQKIRDEENVGWQKWLSKLSDVREWRIPRCMIPADFQCESVQLHVFCDASLMAYSAVAYVRCESSRGRSDECPIHTMLVAAKCRVASLKPMTVPRLELQAALLAAKLAKSTADELDIFITRRVFWSDSITVLRWVRTEPRTKQIFVANRLGQINELSHRDEWRWVPSGKNPADDATRWTDNQQSSIERWLRGPDFLRQSESLWPISESLTAEQRRELDCLEVRKSLVFTVLAREPLELSLPIKCLGWEGLLIIARRVQKWVDRWKSKAEARHSKDNTDLQVPVERPITIESITSAEKYWYRCIQSESFDAEIKALEKGKPLPKNSKIRKLSPYLDTEGILRANGRVTVALDYVFNNSPIILEGNHPATKTLIRKYHRKYFHGSTNTVINEIRQIFFITKLRKILQSFLVRCVTCRIQRAKPHTPVMAALPAGRLAYRERPFTHCGLDYFGPLLVKVGRRREKRWGALFTCLTTRAVHLELAHTLSASSAIMAMQRLAARRGTPTDIYSDNGTNFRGASRELEDAIKALDQRRPPTWGELGRG